MANSGQSMTNRDKSWRCWATKVKGKCREDGEELVQRRQGAAASVAHLLREDKNGDNIFEACPQLSNVKDLSRSFGKCQLAMCARSTIYVKECTAVQVLERRFETCAHDIPVVSNDTELFMDPFTGALMKSTNRICSHECLPSWKVGNVWYCIAPYYVNCDQMPQAMVWNQIQKDCWSRCIGWWIMTRTRQPVLPTWMK